MAPEGRWFSSQRLRLRYWVWGDEANPPVVLIHGTRDHARSWDRTAEVLSGRYAVYAPDLRGHGDSDWAAGGTYAIAEYLQDLHALLAELDRHSYTLLGHSVGGSVAVLYASAFPERVERLVSLEGLGYDWRPSSTPGEHLRGWVERSAALGGRPPRTMKSLAEAADRMREANTRLDPELAAHLAEHGTREVDGGGYQWKFDPFTRSDFAMPTPPDAVRGFWSSVRCPLLLLWSSDGWASGGFDPADVLPEFPNAVGHEIGGAGHHLHHDQFEMFIGRLQAFLDAGDRRPLDS